MYSVYILVHKNKVRYVGKTDDPKHRLWMHIYRGRKQSYKTHLGSWLNLLVKNGEKVDLIVIENYLTKIQSAQREIYWIKELRLRGHELVNSHDGGEGFGSGNKIWLGRKHKKETIEKMRLPRKGFIFPVEWRLNISKARGRKSGNKKYKSKPGHLRQAKQVSLYNAISGKLIRKFSSILECSKIMNLNRGWIISSAKTGNPYLKYKFKIDGEPKEKAL